MLIAVFSAYELYCDPRSDEPTQATQVGSQKTISMADRFKNAFSHKAVRVHFVGAWYVILALPFCFLCLYQRLRDTVSSIGIARGHQMLPRTIDGMKHVCYFRHALALDERRVKFLPEYAYGGTAQPPGNLEGGRSLTSDHIYSDSNNPPDEGTEHNPRSAFRTLDETLPSIHENRVDCLQAKKGSEKHKHTMEVWFAGTHSDM